MSEQQKMLILLKETIANNSLNNVKTHKEISLKTDIDLNKKRKRSRGESQDLTEKKQSNWEAFQQQNKNNTNNINNNNKKHLKFQEKQNQKNGNLHQEENSEIKEIIQKKQANKKKNKEINQNNGIHDVVSLQPLSNTNKGETPILAIDCEMVQCENNSSELARVSIVNYNGHVLIDSFVRPNKKITNYLTWVSGITFAKIKDAPFYSQIKEKLHKLFENKILIGHSIQNDLRSLEYILNEKKVRDISKVKLLKGEDGRTISLKNMAKQHLNIDDFQNGAHDSVDDARATLMIYKKFQKEIEVEYKQKTYQNLKSQLLQDIPLLAAKNNTSHNGIKHQ